MSGFFVAVQRLVGFLRRWKVFVYLPAKENRKWRIRPRYRYLYGRSWTVRLRYVAATLTNAKFHKANSSIGGK
jgi:hypothetical protein